MNEDLMREAGFGGTFKTYKNLSVDNGSNISGSDATGEFVELSFNNETKEKIKKQHGKSFDGVILLSRAVLTYRDNTQTKKKIWETEEFNPLITKKRDGEKALIPIYKLDFNGQRQKDDNGKFIVEYAYYDDLSTGKKANIKELDFSYTIVLYILIFEEETGNKEIVKLRFRGASRGNFFKYQQNLWKEFRLKSVELYTTFSVYLENTYGKYAVSFKPVLLEDGQPMKYNNMAEIEDEIGSLLLDYNNKKESLAAPSNFNTFKIANQEIKSIEEVKDAQTEAIDNKIKVEDIPF
jgi:hypothetical protein